MKQTLASRKITRDQGIGEHVASAEPRRLDSIGVEIAQFNDQVRRSREGVLHLDGCAYHHLPCGKGHKLFEGVTPLYHELLALRVGLVLKVFRPDAVKCAATLRYVAEGRRIFFDTGLADVKTPRGEAIKERYAVAVDLFAAK